MLQDCTQRQVGSVLLLYYAKVYTVFKLLEDEDVDLKMECFSNPSEEENITYYRDIIETLQAKNKFDVAREFADTIGLSTNQITVNKLLSELSITQQSTLWQRYGGRETFWFKCNQTFHQHQTSPSIATDFFKTQAAKQSTLVQQVSIKEKEQLLGLAYHWLARQHPPVQREELDKLEQQIWKCRIQKEVENAEKSPMGTEAIKLDEMFRLPESKRIEPYFGHLGKEELLIKEKYNIDRNTESPLTNTKERQAVDKLIGRQLDKCCVSQALKLANLFKYLSENLAIVMTCLQLAQGLQTVDQMDAMMKDLPKKHKDKRASWTLVGGTLSRSTSFASLSSVQTEYMSQDAEDILDAMETIAEHCILGKTACDRIINCYSIAQILNKSYESVVRQDCFDVLKEVLTSDHPHRFELSKTYIRSSGVNDEELAGFLSDAITHSLSVFTGYDFTDAPYTGGELIFSPVSNKENFPMLVKLCDDPAVLGNRLLDTAISLASSNTDNSSLVFTMETELIVRSHQCHTMCYSMEGIASVLRTCRSRSVVLAAAEEYSLLVRILTGVGRYSEMTYIFDILMKVQQFELLFKKGIKHDKLKVALLDYLKRHHPADKETFTMVALKFSMHREIAESLEHEAKTYLQHIQNQYRNIESSPELQSTLQNTLQFYTEAAQSYVKVGCRRHAEQCVKQARLLALQIHLLSSRTKVINLSQREVNIFIAKHPRFPEALIVSDAYGKRMEWSTAIYNNVVADGDFRYLDDFRHHLSLTSELYSELAVRYKHESSKSSTLTSNMKKVLLYCPDIQVQYRLATELGFNEMATTMLQGDGGAYLRDVT
ncbi:spatacsin-like [Glandiceps talaboti]